MTDPRFPAPRSAARPDVEEHASVLGGSLERRDGGVSEQAIPLVEETVTVGKEEVVTGRVRIRTNTDTVQELARAELARETVEVTRVPVDKMVEFAPEIRTEGDLTIVPVVEEILVVEKRLLLKEELHIRRRTDTETVEAPVTLRKQRATVERLDDGTFPPQEEALE